MPESKYEPELRIVAFLDILGFREQTRRCLEDPALLEILDRSLSSADMLTQSYDGYRTDARMFSDCICSSSPFTPDNVFKFLYSLEAVQMNLACNGAFIRGGIAIGKHFENKRMIVSEGLIEAYLLESKQAVFPRIIVSEDTFLRLSEALANAGPDSWDGGPTSIASSIDRHLRKDRDGVRYLSYLMSLHRIDRSSIVMSYMDKHKDSVEKWFTEGKNTDVPPSVRAKHEWVRDYHNLAMSEYFQCPIGDEDEFIK